MRVIRAAGPIAQRPQGFAVSLFKQHAQWNVVGGSTRQAENQTFVERVTARRTAGRNGLVEAISTRPEPQYFGFDSCSRRSGRRHRPGGPVAKPVTFDPQLHSGLKVSHEFIDASQTSPSSSSCWRRGSEGLQLLGRPADPVVTLPDWRLWVLQTGSKR